MVGNQWEQNVLLSVLFEVGCDGG